MTTTIGAKRRRRAPRWLATDGLISAALMLLTVGILYKVAQLGHRRAGAAALHQQPLEVGTSALRQVGVPRGVSGEARAGSRQPSRAAAAQRQAKQAAEAATKPPLPSLDGLELHPKNGRHMLPRSELFVHQGNYNKLMDHYAGESGLHIHNNRSFPAPDMRILRRYNFSSCAVVGNSGSLLNSSFGAAIDSYNVVVRINQAPPGLADNRYKRHVGTKTTFRLINTRWTGKYGITNYVDEGKLPLEQSVTVIVTRARPHAYDTFVQTLKKVRSDVSVLYMSSRVIGAAHRFLVSYRERLAAAGFGPFDGGDTPSSGFIAVYLMLQACNNVTLYGFGLDAEDGQSQQYHYFHIFSPKHSKKKNSMNKTHSFNTERELLRALAQEKIATFCSYIPGDSKHNRRCGFRKAFAEQQRKGRVQTDSFDAEFDAVPEMKKPRAAQTKSRFGAIID
eukprot:jgi/Tetstr1/437680/TSEL_000238.t1